MVALSASSTRSFFSFSSVSVWAPTCFQPNSSLSQSALPLDKQALNLLLPYQHDNRDVCPQGVSLLLQLLIAHAAFIWMTGVITFPRSD